MKQNYERYNSVDHEVWNILFDRQVENLKDKAIAPFIDAFRMAGDSLVSEKVPNFDSLNKALAPYTGWSIEVVPGLIPVGEFFELLAKKRFPSSTWLRKMEELDYLEEPDMFHDIFGHIPLLFNERYANFMQKFGQLGYQLRHSEDWVKAMERLYWFTVEFGLCYNSLGQIEIIGAGILSSFGETNQIYIPGSCEFRDFDVEAVLNHVFYKHEMQSIYYVLEDYDAMFAALERVEALAGFVV